MAQFGRVPVELNDRLVERQRAGAAGPVSPAVCVQVFAVVDGVWCDRDGGVAFPSHATIADRCALSVATVRRALEELRAVGAVTWTAGTTAARGRGSNRYRLALDLDPDRSPVSTRDGGRSLTSEHAGGGPIAHPRATPSLTSERPPRSPMSEEPEPVNQNQMNHNPACASEDDMHHDPLPIELAPLAKPTPVKRHSWTDRTDTIVRGYRDWYRGERGHPCPQSHTVLAKIVDRFGEVDEGRLKRALAAVPTVSIRAVELELNRSRPRPAAAAAQAPADALAAFRAREAARAMGGAS